MIGCCAIEAIASVALVLLGLALGWSVLTW
jgi:hypothetical protein